MSEPATVPSLLEGVLESRREIAPGVCLLRFETRAGNRGEGPRPGQFFLVDCDGGREHILRRPLSAFDAYYSDNSLVSVEFLVEAVGWGTRRLCSVEEGGTVGLLGPLGRPLEDGKGTPLLVAGGMGIAPLHFLAREMDRRDKKYLMLAGFKSGAGFRALLSGLDGEAVIYTEDGSEGETGMVSQGVASRLESGKYERVISCGPEAMMASVSEICERARVPCTVSLVARMACGLGACRGCVRRGRGGRNLCVCQEGPAFDSREVLWRS